MPGVVAHAAHFLDQLGDALCSPEIRREAERLRPMLEARNDPSSIGFGEFRLTTRTSRVSQRTPTAVRELLRPAIDGLTMHTHLASHLRFTQALLQQPCSFEPTRFERREIPPHPRRKTHAMEIAHWRREVTILRGPQ